MDVEVDTSAAPEGGDLSNDGVEETSPVAEIETDTEGVEPTPEEAAEARRAARLKAAEEAEQAQARARAERARRIRAAEEQAAQNRWRQEQARYQQERQEWERTIAEQRALLAKGGPDALKALGVDYATLTQQFLEENSPDAQARKLQARLDELERREQERQERIAQEQEAQREQANLSHATSLLDAHAEQFPHAFDLPRHLQVGGIKQARAELAARYGQDPTYEQIFHRLDQVAAELHAETEKRRAMRARPLPSDGDTERDAALSATQGDAPRPLSNQLAAAKASKKPAQTEEELDRLLMAELREAVRKDARSSR